MYNGKKEVKNLHGSLLLKKVCKFDIYSLPYTECLVIRHLYATTSFSGLYEKVNPQFNIKAHLHTEMYTDDLLINNSFHIQKKTEVLAYVNLETNSKVYFNIVIANKC